jgi:response regulator RpfG family c-di-GMP phosphodiesterase
VSEQAILLLVDRDERSIQTFRATLEVERRVRLVVAPNGEDALRMSRDVRPDLIVIAHDIQGMNVFSFCQALRQDPLFESTMLVLEIERGANDMRFAGLTFGVDEYLTRPVEPAEILTKVHTMLRLRKAYDAVRADQAELKQLHESLRASFDQLLQLMARVLDMRLPGAAERGRRIAELARKVADRFGVPATHLNDLEVAARLHELGKVVWSQSEGEATPTTRTLDDWKYIVGTRAVFSQVEGLAGATELVGALYENWDGSGHPDHLQSGQIPLRSRILRVLVDLFATLGSRTNPSMTNALEELQDQAGTRYDPMVIVHLRAVLQGADDGDVRGKHVVVPVPELRAGMVLAEDLCTDSGLKLLARNTRLTAPTLEVILRRHAAEPLANGATVTRASI